MLQSCRRERTLPHIAFIEQTSTAPRYLSKHGRVGQGLYNETFMSAGCSYDFGEGSGVGVGVGLSAGLARALSPTKLMGKMQIIPRKGSV